MTAFKRPRIFCINWSRPDLPKAGVLVQTRDGDVTDAFFDTWAEAVAWVNRYAPAWADFQSREGADR